MGKEAAIATGRLETLAVKRDVTDAGGRPDVVHCPHNGLATVEYLADTFQGKHALIDPRKVDDIGFLEF